MISTLKTPLNVEIKMKKLLTLISILLIISCGDKVREEITERYDDGSKMLLVKYKGEGSDEVVTERVYYDIKGDTIRYDNVLKKTGFRKSFHSNGNLQYVGEHFEEDIIKMVFYDDTGVKQSMLKISDLSKLEYLQTYFYDDGNISSEGFIKTNEQHSEIIKNGEWIEYNKDGSKRSKQNYINDKKTGKKTYFDNK